MFKRSLFIILGLFLMIGLVACGETSSGNTDKPKATDSSKEDNEEKVEEENKEEEKLGLGDTAEVDNIKLTIKNVSLTEERNEFADKNPNKVVKIEYEVENNSDKDIPIGADLQVYDGTGNQVESYPLENTIGSLKSGKKIQGIEHFGIEEGPIEVYFQPMLSMADEAIFELNIE